MIRRLVLSTVFTAFLAPASFAQQDVSSNVPGGWPDVMRETRGVVVRVPVDRHGNENTNAAEMRFYQGDRQVTRDSDARELWRRSVDPGDSDVATGANIPHRVDAHTGRDSSTWGWWNWYGLGWTTPYYYSYWYPTFYWGGNYWQYQYYTNWWYPGYQYYYYWWYWYW